MNKKIKDVFISNGYIYYSKDVEKRISDERLSLKKLICKSDYLTRYNMAVRYLFLDILAEGYDIHTKKVHPAIETYCVHQLQWPRGKIRKIIKARHLLKYYKVQPDISIDDNLNELLKMMSGKIF
jgi:hypothetical protein